MRRATTVRRPTATAVAALVRIPNLFTAPPDVILGAALAAGVGATGAAVTVSPVAVAGLAVASMLLYAGGTTLNDAFDAPVDAVERPDRPIPSGEISRQTGFALGAALLLVGVATAVGANGLESGAVATLIALAVVLYDGVLKGGPFGFLAMGAARGLNVVLGLSLIGTVPPTPWLLPPAAVFAYIAAVTFMAEGETTGENRGAVVVAFVAAVGAAIAAGVHHALVGPSTVAAVVGLAFVGAFVLWTGSRLRAAYLDPTPATVGPAVGTCILGLVVLDAAFAAATGVAWAIAAVAFLVLAIGLAQAFDVT